MFNILVYTFFSRTKVTSRGLYNFDSKEYPFEKLFISSRFATNKLLSQLPKYDYVIGIADHNKNATRSRFDPKYINKYSKRILVENGEEIITSNLDIILPNNFYKFSSTTNGPCNRSSYQIMDIINKKNLNTKFGFFHLCKKTWKDDFKNILGRIEGDL